LHFATHGFLPVEPGEIEPALVLSIDGTDQDQMMLKVSEISKLQIHADMVVLSACNTGSGKVTHAEGVSSLGTAFLSAGSSSVVVSLWKVSDSSTSLLMQQFYKNLLSGVPKNKALADARKYLFSQGKSHPFYWAPFVLSGD
jgi:CHAT domain-containing protein